ncbi:BTAD domain-containing putative transcriptional regulator [Nocardia sp. NPDC059195]|uniref:BTAD domain-containing putative transcriptional regulator n=1 Tax=Nocardia sp. NPDC059195 TaxID=3346765 RepID=UPI0036B3455A
MTVLIALTGLSSRTGVTTTAVALADAWPGAEPAIVVEADPAGGQLAQLADADPERGLVSLAAAATHSPGAAVAAQVWEHVQRLPSGVAFLAAPDKPAAMAATLTVPVTAPTATSAGLAELVVIADCGVADPSSPAAPITAGADVLIVVVHSDLTDPVDTGRRIREVTAGSRRRAVLIVGSEHTDEFTTALGVPVLGRLPLDRRGAEALLGTDPPRRRGHSSLEASARVVTAALHSQLSLAPAPHGSSRGLAPRPRLASWWRRRGTCASKDIPRVYPLHQAPALRGSRTDTTTVTNPDDDFGLEITDTDEPAAEVATDSPEPALDASPMDRSALPGSPLAIEVFGPLRVSWNPGEGDVDITARLQPRARELLTLLVLHPDGMTRETLIADLWGEQCPARPVNALHTALSRLNNAIGAATDGAVPHLLTADHHRYQLDPATITSDYQRFAQAVRQRRHTSTDTQSADACHGILDTARRGVLAADLTAHWVAPIREAARRDTITAVGALAAASVDQRPRHALDLLETALEHDPLNEMLWRDILRLHARLGEHSAIERTMSLLAHKLAQINEELTPETRQLAQKLQQQAPH